MNSDNREAEVIDLDSVENMKIDVDGGSEEEEQVEENDPEN